jgi:hypothetical protein
MPLTFIVLALWLTAAPQGSAITPSPDLAAARALYASGAYEEALARLATVRDDSSAAEAAQYRALCFVALGRNAEAQRALEELFTRMPLFKMSEADVAPRVVAMYQQVRRRLLPSLAKSLYAGAKASFEQRQYAVAASQFRTMLTLLGDEDDLDDATGLTDLKLLADGFLKLAEGQAAAAPKVDAKPAAPSRDDQPNVTARDVAPAMPPAAPASPGRPANSIYSAADADVTPPVEFVRAMPAWHPPNNVAARRTFEGVLRIVIDERGSVESANMVENVSPGYDELLLAAARLWQYRPARRNGQAVKYEKLITITLAPGAGRS